MSHNSGTGGAAPARSGQGVGPIGCGRSCATTVTAPGREKGPVSPSRRSGRRLQTIGNRGLDCLLSSREHGRRGHPHRHLVVTDRGFRPDGTLVRWPGWPGWPAWPRTCGARSPPGCVAWPWRRARRVATVPRRGSVLIHLAQVALVDQGRRVEGVPGLLPEQSPVGDPLEVFVPARYQTVDGRSIARFPLAQEPCDSVHPGRHDRGVTPEPRPERGPRQPERGRWGRQPRPPFRRLPERRARPADRQRWSGVAGRLPFSRLAK